MVRRSPAACKAAPGLEPRTASLSMNELRQIAYNGAAACAPRSPQTPTSAVCMRKMERHDVQGWADLSDSTLRAIFTAVPPLHRRALAAVCRKWARVCQQSSELWERVQISLPADFLTRVDVSALYRWFLSPARHGLVRALEWDIGCSDAWTVIYGVLGIVGRQLEHLRVASDAEGCYEAGGRAAWMSLVPGLRSLEIENAADWTIGRAARFPQGLTRLELTYCGEEGLPAVPEHLGSLPGLVSLSLQGSQLDSQMALEGLQHCTQLQRLNLAECCLEEVPPALSAVRGLTCLTLNSNTELGGEDNERRVAPLAALTALRVLEMRDCGLNSVPASVTGLTSLRTLLLAMNCFTSRAPCILPGPYLAGLTLLGLSDCFDEDCGVTLEHLAEQLEGASGLEVLRINRNPGLGLTAAGLGKLLLGKPRFRRLDLSSTMAAPDTDLAALQARLARCGVQLVYNYS